MFHVILAQSLPDAILGTLVAFARALASAEPSAKEQRRCMHSALVAAEEHVSGPAMDPIVTGIVPVAARERAAAPAA